MNKTQTKLFQSFFAVNLPLFEDLVKNVCIELGHEDRVENMLNKFLYQDKKKFTKILNKKNNNNKRRKTTYSMFLADKTVLGNLKAKYPELNLSELNKKKGEYWRNTVKQSPELLAVYQAQADKANKLMNKTVEPVAPVAPVVVEIVEEIKEEIIDEETAELVVDPDTLEIPKGLTTPPTNSPVSVCPPAPKKQKKTRKPRAKKSKQ